MRKMRGIERSCAGTCRADGHRTEVIHMTIRIFALAAVLGIMGCAVNAPEPEPAPAPEQTSTEPQAKCMPIKCSSCPSRCGNDNGCLLDCYANCDCKMIEPYCFCP
jgi:hypothetical protein